MGVPNPTEVSLLPYGAHLGLWPRVHVRIGFYRKVVDGFNLVKLALDHMVGQRDSEPTYGVL